MKEIRLRDKHKILLAVTGLTPQIVTETLYALTVDSPNPWIPDEIRLITTAEGAERARLTLLDAETGHFHALCRDYDLTGQIHFDAASITVIRGHDGQPLADIRTPEDNTLAADTLLACVREMCTDERNELHVSIAGGRKTMGFFLGYALSLFGRPQDRLSHVLVNDPFESLTDFFYPPRIPKVLFTRDGRPMHTASAQVMLAEIPFVRLREGLPKEALLHGKPFAALVSTAQTAISPPALRFNIAQRQLYCGQDEVKLPPALFAWYAWLAECRQAGLGEGGFVRFADVSPEDYLDLYAQVVGPDSEAFSKIARNLAQGFEHTQFEQYKSKINRELRKQLSLASPGYEIVCQGERPWTRYGLTVNHISFVGISPKR